ncbi:unnamed protein product [Auanema sp. JU1783]|nr:unnamed protein product [Auanema sp. JU1783]
MDFLDNQAEESDGYSSSNDDQPKPKKQKFEKGKHKGKKSKRIQQSSDEDEYDDEEEDEEMKQFIADEDEEEEKDDDKSEKSGNASEEDLDEEDFELIDENLDRPREITVHNVHYSDSDEDDDQKKIQNSLFGKYADDQPSSHREEERYAEQYSDSEQSENDFIVNEYDGKPVHSRNKRRDLNLPEGALDEAREIFGVEDFNLDDFYDEDEEQLDDEEDEIVDEEGEGVRRIRKEIKKSTLLDTLEPAELERGYLAPRDKKIQLEDKPERFQIRKTPVTEVSESEAELEAKWIFRYAFSDDDALSRQDSRLPAYLKDISEMDRAEREEKAISVIKEILKFIRNQLFEVPFIAYYRKEIVGQVFETKDLWRIYEFDEKWCHLRNRKDKLMELMKRMQAYLLDGEPLSRRQLTESDISEVYCVDTAEALADVYTKFQLYYGPDIARMQEWERSRVSEGDETAALATRFKQCLRSDKYQLCVECGIGDMVSRFGLTAHQFAENLDWKKHDVQQDPIPVMKAAEDYITNAFPSVDDVVNGAVYMMAKEISCEPMVRNQVRRMYRSRVKMSARPTKQGREQMDDTHPLWHQRYLKDKDIRELENEDFMYFKQMKDQGNMLFTVSCDSNYERETSTTLVDRILADGPFKKDEYSELVEGWNEVRERAVKMALNQLLIPYFEKELCDRLLEEAKKSVVTKCAKKIAECIDHAPFKPDDDFGEDEEEFSRLADTRVMAITYPTDPNEAAFGALIDRNGSVMDYVRLVNFTQRNPPNFTPEKKMARLESLKKFIERKRPHIIAIAAENMDAMRLQRDVEDVLRTLMENDTISRKPNVAIMNNEVAKVYMNSRQAMTEHVDYPPLLRQAVSLARYVMDPLVEISHLFNHEEDIMCLALHPLQKEINKDDLMLSLQHELITVVNHVGVDVNKCIEYNHASYVMQFISGLGPRKSGALLKIIKQHDGLLESRTKLVTLCKMGPKVFMNSSGFLKIDTEKVAERTDGYVEVLDGSRVHPETYEWARKMAVDAIEADDNTDPTAALEEILQTPDRLRDLDLDAFAEELKRQGFGEKKDTLYDIAAELNQRYKDNRPVFFPPSQEELFSLLCNTKYFSEGRRVLGTVIGVQYKKLSEEERMDESHNRNSANMLVCKHCHTSFHEMKELWTHTSNKDTRFGGCPGVPAGVKIRLENDVLGFIPNKMLSDNPESFKNPLEKVQKNGLVWCRIMSVDSSKMSCLLSSRTSDLNKDMNESKDQYWDGDAEQDDIQQDDLLKQQMKKQRETKWVKRVIQHPNFYNITFADAERLLSKMEQGDVVIRPSSKGTDRLTITWKVAEGVLQNIDVFEEEKEQPFTLGKKLYIDTRERREEFEDLNEILARWIQPMAANAREIIQHKCFIDNIYGDNMDAIVKHLNEEKRKAPSRFPYAFTPAVNEWAGKFVLSYLTGRAKHEYITVTPEGLRFRYIMFESLNRLLAWFKVHYRDNPAMSQQKHSLQRR